AHQYVHAALRDRAHVRLVGAHHRAERGQQDDPPDSQLCRPRGPEIRSSRKAQISRKSFIRNSYMSATSSNARPNPDQVLVDIVDYVLDYRIDSTLALETARNRLIDTLGCGLEALEYPACRKLLGPIVPGTVVPNGAKVPGTQFQLDPVQAAFNI